MTEFLCFQTFPAGSGEDFHVDFESGFENHSFFEPGGKNRRNLKILPGNVQDISGTFPGKIRENSGKFPGNPNILDLAVPGTDQVGKLENKTLKIRKK